MGIENKYSKKKKKNDVENSKEVKKKKVKIFSFIVHKYDRTFIKHTFFYYNKLNIEEFGL